MNSPPRWDLAVSHRGEEADDFIRNYFGQEDRRVLLIGGAEFDPRTTAICERMNQVAPGRVRGFFIREERPRSVPSLLERAEQNIQRLHSLLADYRHENVQIISEDNAV